MFFRSHFGMSCSLFLTLMIVASCAEPARSQQGPGNYVKEAADRIAKLVDDAAKQKYSLPKDSFSTGGAMIKKDTAGWVPIFTVQLTAGRSYIFLAAGDNDTKDLDLDIQDSSGRVLAADTETSPVANVPFEPKVSGRYTVRLRLYDSRNSVPCYCFATVMVKE